MYDQFWYLLISLFLTLICDELLKGNKYGIIIARELEVLGDKLGLTDGYFAAKVSLDIGIGLNTSGMTDTSLLKNVVYEVVIVVIVRTSISVEAERH